MSIANTDFIHFTDRRQKPILVSRSLPEAPTLQPWHIVESPGKGDWVSADTVRELLRQSAVVTDAAWASRCKLLEIAGKLARGEYETVHRVAATRAALRAAQARLAESIAMLEEPE